jgi:hypothetical protein
VVFLQALIPNSRYGKNFSLGGKGGGDPDTLQKIRLEEKFQIVEPMEEF